MFVVRVNDVIDSEEGFVANYDSMLLCISLIIAYLRNKIIE